MQCCITSPPYFGLRDYGTAEWVGGDPDCDHKARRPDTILKSKTSSTLDGSKATVHASHNFPSECGRCGAIRKDGQLGLESTPKEYIANLVAVFAEVHRVLKKDGTLWLNLGDSYAGSGRGRDADGTPNPSIGEKQATNIGAITGRVVNPDSFSRKAIEGDTILDPFNGTGTTGLVALRNNRNYIGIELNPEYIEISEERLKDVQPRLV